MEGEIQFAPPAVHGYFCRACGVMHADSPPIVTPEALSVQQVRAIRGICELRATGTRWERALGLVEICALLGVRWLNSDPLEQKH